MDIRDATRDMDPATMMVALVNFSPVPPDMPSTVVSIAATAPEQLLDTAMTCV